jgi:hypothetical protein
VVGNAPDFAAIALWVDPLDSLGVAEMITPPLMDRSHVDEESG